MRKVCRFKIIPILLVTFIISLSGCKTENPENKEPMDIQKKTQEKETVTQLPENSQPLTQENKTFIFTQENFKRVDGSTATIPLSEAAASELLALKPEEAKRTVSHSKTDYAYQRLINNEVDIILVTEPSKEELELAEKNKVEIEVIPIVKDAFVFLVNKKNAIDSLTLKQIRDIYSGNITNWKEVGGKDSKILSYQRPLGSGSQTLMLNMVMKDIQIISPEKHMEPSGMGELIEMIAGYDNSEFALGYSVYYYANTMYIRDTVKLLGVNSVKPEPGTIKSGQYPLTSAYYAVIRKSEPEGSFAREFLKWVLSEQGQKVAEKAGYIPLR